MKSTLLFILPIIYINNLFASSNIDRAFSYFQNEEYQQALYLYSTELGFSARMGEGNSAYRLNKFKYATRQYTRALLKAKNNVSKKNALYNMANAYYKDNQFIKSIETYKYLLKLYPEFENAQNNLWSAQSMLIDLLKSKPQSSIIQSPNYDINDQSNSTEDPFNEKINTKVEKIGYLRTLIGDRVAEGELNAIINNTEQFEQLIFKARQIKNYLSAVKKLEFVKDHPQLILKSIIKFEETKYSN